MNEPMGIATELAAKRRAIASRLSPGARAQLFPHQFAKPIPVERDDAKLRRQLRMVEGKLDEAKAEITRLRALDEQHRKTIADMQARGYHSIPADPTVSAIIRKFVNEYNALAALENRVGIEMSELFSQRRNNFITPPRHVAMWLCKTLTDMSLPKIGHAFGGRDHTTVMSALRSVHTKMAKRPDLAFVAKRVQAHFAPQMAKAA